MIANYDARTAVERELVLRLASLLWRLRRATAIETELLTIQAEILHDRRLRRSQGGSHQHLPDPTLVARFHSLREECCDERDRGRTESHLCNRPPGQTGLSRSRDLALCFQRLANFDNGAFERLGRYESALMR